VSLRVLAPTWLECLALLAVRVPAPVSQSGIGLRKLKGIPAEDTLLICGLAGGVQANQPAGTVLIPTVVSLETGERRECDPEWVEAFIKACTALALPFRKGPMLTVGHIVTGSATETLARRGYLGVDMETGLLPAGRRVASVRVVLDTPDRPLSRTWERGSTAAFNPSTWRALVWLGIKGPAYSLRAARVLKRAIQVFDSADLSG
jgi:4-hydroxy-3-methylbut-2-en-1-yl diphosphate reductase